MQNEIEKKFNLGDAISYGWNTVIKNIWFFIGLALITTLISYIPNIVNIYVKNNVVSSLVTIVFWIVNAYISIGIIQISLKFIDKKKASYNDIFSNITILLNYILGSILYGLIVLAGIILLVVPGIIWGIKYQYFSYFVIDEGLGPVEALKKSGELTSGVKWDLFVFNIVIAGVIILGLLVLGIGILVAIPVTWIAAAFVFRQLQGKEKMSSEKAEVATEKTEGEPKSEKDEPAPAEKTE